MSDTLFRLNAALEGRYHIERQLGEGGMATVYLARDEKHKRSVALKVLKPELAAVVGAERFLAEIETTANLQHPHILPLFDSGEADGFLYYVMPYVEGESLRDRLKREKQLPVDEAVRIAADVAEALHSAHEQGVIHRDVKPANILLGKGRPLVADFGIALAVSQAGGGRLTETGLSMGTPYYMSPEQASADREPTPASDVYSLGCVLYEMLVGEPPYVGSSAQAVLAKILTGDAPAANATRPSIPANVDAAIARALEKLPADRFRGAQDFAKALADPAFRHGEVAVAEGMAGGGPWKRLTLALATTTLLFGLAFGWSALRPEAPAGPVVRFTVPVGEGAELFLGGERDASFGRPASTSLALSPGGDVLVYAGWQAATDGGVPSRLYLRRLESERAVPFEGTEGASDPLFSPDGAWIGFLVGSSLRRVPLAGGDVETIVPDVGSRAPRFHATWGDDGAIVYSSAGVLHRVAESGGDPELLAEPDSVPGGFAGIGHPHLLPGGDKLLFVGAPSFVPEEWEVLAMDLVTGSVTPLLTDAADPRYTQTGHLLFMRQGALMAVAFDADRLELEGQPFVVAEDVQQAFGMPNSTWESGRAQVAVSAAGHLVYARGGTYPARPRVLMRVTLDGDAEPLGLDPREYGKIRVSPDGGRLALSVRNGRSASLHIHDLARRVTQPLSGGGFVEDSPEWSPDGRSIAFHSNRDGPQNLYRMAVDGSGGPERLAPSSGAQTLMSWSSTGVIAYLEGGDIWMLPPDGEPEVFFASGAAESFATFSPDGRWLAYVSNQTGTDEVYVRPYPGPDPATLISSNGGLAPVWSHDGRRLFFRARGAMMVAELSPEGGFRADPAVPLIDPWPYSQETPTRAFDMLEDGAFVASEWAEPLGEGGTRERYRVDELHVVLNLFEELRARSGG